jgi:hypothetical protein
MSVKSVRTSRYVRTHLHTWRPCVDGTRTCKRCKLLVYAHVHVQLYIYIDTTCLYLYFYLLLYLLSLSASPSTYVYVRSVWTPLYLPVRWEAGSAMNASSVDPAIANTRNTSRYAVCPIVVSQLSPVQSCPVLSCHAISCQLCPALSCHVIALSCLVLSCFVLFCRWTPTETA